MNQVILEGRIVSDLKKKSEKAPCEFRVETRDEWRGEKIEGKSNNQYHAVAVWGAKGNWASKNLKRNDIIRLEGFLQHKTIEFNPKDEDGQPVLDKNGKPLMIKTLVSEVKVRRIERLGSAIRKEASEDVSLSSEA